MSPHTQPHGLVRTLLLVVSTLAVVGVVFAIYIHIRQMPEQRRVGAAPVAVPSVPPASETATQPAGSEAMRIEGVPLPKGERTRINLYGSEGIQARLELEVDSWEPVGNSGREFRLEKPTIRFRTPAGQLVNVSADSGLVEMARQRGDNYDLARGRLEGNVAVLMDRLSTEQRAQLPPEQRDELTDERKIQVELDDLTFDMEYARVESSGRVRAVLAEAEFEGRGLLLRYNEPASRIEYLKIAEGKRILLRGMGRSFAIALPGATQPETAEVDEKTETSAKKESSDSSELAADIQPVEDDGVPLFVPDASKKPRTRETVTYIATFEDKVAVDQFEGQTQTGFLNADLLRFLFDFGQEQRELTRQPPASRPPGTEPGDGEAAHPFADVEESWVLLSWNGPLVVDLVRDQGEVSSDIFGKRLQVTATGGEVHIADRQGSARCRKLVYHYETKQAWLYGGSDSAFALDIGTGARLSGRKLSFDPRGQTATVTGPGMLSDQQADDIMPGAIWGSQDQGGEVSITFREKMNLRLGTLARESFDPMTGELVVRRREYLQSAELLGDVLMVQDSDSIAAELVKIDFRPPVRDDAMADTIENFHAEGGVRMLQGDERITCRSLDVSFTRDANGRLVPERADAQGDVAATQRDRTITAGERMIVNLQSVAVEKPPFDLVQAKVIAVRQGLNFEEIDWDAQRKKYERQGKLALGLRRIQAFGGVNVEDPEQNLHIDAGRLDCTFSEGRRIDRGVVIGRGALPAGVEFGDFGIMGREIEFDASAQWAEVPGAGRLAFTSRKDLDGRSITKPIPMSVTWTDFMRFRGLENTAVFTGSVHAVSRTSTFDCRELVLDFEDEEPHVSAGPPSPGVLDWWVLQPFQARFRRGAERLRLEAPRVRKQLAYLSANGDVIGLTATYDEVTGVLKTRARLAGPHLAVDLRNKTQAMTIDDAGTLLIEDYRLRPSAESGNVTKMSPFGAKGDNLPSQTFISWGRAMSFYGGNRLAVFEKDVELVYRSGSKLLLADGLLDGAMLDKLRESTEGRDARLLCQQLNVQFIKKANGDASASAVGMSGNEIYSFSASGGVYFEDSGVSVTCRTVTFNRERELLQVLGTREQPAELIDQRRGQYTSYKGPTIYWERDTDRIEAPRSTIRIH